MTTGQPRALAPKLQVCKHLELTRKFGTQQLDYINMEQNRSPKASRIGGQGPERYLAGEKADRIEYIIGNMT